MKDVESGKPSEMVASSKGEAPPQMFGIPLKHFVLVLLTVQNAGAVLLMRYTRSIPGETEFITQTAVIMQEFIKGLTCVIILLHTEGTMQSAWAQPKEALKTAVPALLYLGQNNLQYIAVGLLDAATYTVTYQTKTIWSGIFTVFLLGRTLKSNKWLGLAMLSIGVGVVQLSGIAKAKEHDASNGTDLEVSDRASGFFIILFAAALSSMAGVYFEMILKGVRVSLWTRNLQLAGYSVVTAFIPLYVSGQFGSVMEKGFFYGYTSMTWACILMNAFGGLLVGTVIKYADAVTKDVAIGASIVLSSVASTQLFGFEISEAFVIGVVLVIYSVFLYGERATCCGMITP
jgi:UDP-sugar transporter A1/2/3